MGGASETCYKEEKNDTENGRKKRHQSNDDYKQEHITEGPSGAINTRRTSGDSPYCIFKIPRCLTHNNHNAYGYQPTLVAIGPYHRGNQQLNWIEGQKKDLKELFISHTGSGVNEEALVTAVTRRQKDIKRSYLDPSGALSDVNDPSGSANNDKALIQMMVLDGCFLLTLFLENAGKFLKKNQIFNIPWAKQSIRRDLLLLANQIPLFVLQILLKTANFPWPSDLHKIALDFFSHSFGVKPGVNNEHISEAKHLLDLIRLTFILIQPPIKNAPHTSVTTPAEGANNAPQTNVTTPAEGANITATAPQTRKTLPVNKLRSRGLKFKLKKGEQTLLDISFENGVLQIPEIILDDFTSVVLLNCIAFEQFHANSRADTTSYAMFMGCLINSKRDVAYLVEKGIIQNYLGTEEDVSRFFKRILNDYVVDNEKSYLAVVIKDVDNYTSNGCNVWLASFQQNYVGSLWMALSKLAALAILLLTIAQVVLAALALKSSKKD